ncbi:Putative ribose-phosphate pyrophosphokinase-like protein [Candidatus Fokinia solitaria]|uniref:Ribose-phosphate pyrophosphokinase-like protein n=1 Tax=Candidatus Fokinia solitaria TaxID=1802984 RepID=A0A2U8BT36_9RICK|nr:ComF family protein [Candidatus Fokinia solitaria]AWD33478.1 Putative ribose-phosphate pyrophosphokinase-like protein [Candidatus Fokinia solitaria]
MCCKTEVLEYDTLCADCWNNVHFIWNSHCEYCGEITEYNSPSYCLCEKQHLKQNNKEEVFIPFEELYENRERYTVICITLYTHVVINLMMSFKNNAQYFIHRMLSRIFLIHRERFEMTSLVVPVPMHSSAIRQRGYNHAAVMAKDISLSIKKPYLANILIKQYNKIQKNLSEKERVENVKSAFTINKKLLHRIKNEHVLLIDDVMTTGATMQQCTSLLLNNGASFVTILSFAKT